MIECKHCETGILSFTVGDKPYNDVPHFICPECTSTYNIEEVTKTVPLYNVRVIPCEDGGFTGYLEEVINGGGITSQGDSEEELIDNLRDALQLVIMSQHKDK